MQTESSESLSIASSTAPSESQITTTQDGFSLPAPRCLDGDSKPSCRSGPSVVLAADERSTEGHLAIKQLDEASCGLNNREERVTLPGERISEYENAITPNFQQAMGFKVAKRSRVQSNGPWLTDCPNEILTQILSHLHPDSHGAVALVSKRFYSLITEPHAWRMAFLRYFPGQEALKSSQRQTPDDTEDGNRVRSEFRYFTRLTSLASWRSEYLLRTRLMRSVARGKPGTGPGIGSSLRSSHSSRKASAVLTYNSKLPWMVSNVHANFDQSKKGPRVIVGTRDLCVSTVSDPSTGKVEKWGLDDPFSFAQIDELFPNLEPYGLADGPAAVYNVMDLSQPYGMIGGEGFPGGRPYFRATNEVRGRYLGGSANPIIDMSPEVPKIPELLEAICSVWIAKSSAAPAMTQNLVGMMTGSSLGVVSTYALGHDANGPRYKAGDITARWVLSPGVPIIAIKVDDSYNHKRRFLGKIWACAVNALGEVFVLTSTPSPPTEPVRKEIDTTKAAWLTGRSVYWELIESTRRKARADDMDKNAVRGAYSPRSPCDAMGLSKNQIVAEAREIEKFLRYEPAHFRRVCDGWDMRRRVEVDFAEETIVVIHCIQEENYPPEALRHRRVNAKNVQDLDSGQTPSLPPLSSSSMFGAGTNSPARDSSPSALNVSGLHPKSATVSEVGEWHTSRLSLKRIGKAEITSTAMDNSLYAELASFEDPLNGDQSPAAQNGYDTPTSKQRSGGIPGRRARFLAIGTDHGKIVIWNVRDTSLDMVEPICAIQTESPDITSLALSALYLVAGGSDGLVQAWDPLASTTEPIRTLSSKSSGRAPRHIVNANPALRLADYSACPAIFLDPDATSLKGVLCFGTFIRYWTYSSAAPSVGRKRRLRHSDVHGRLASRRQGDAVKGYIAAEEAELRREQEQRSREQARLRNRFGVGLGDLTEEESVRYAQMISEEAFMLEESRRTSASDTGSTADIGETASTSESLETVTPDPSLSGRSPGVGTSKSAVTLADEDDDFEQQIQRALRLSLMENETDLGQSPRANSSTDFEYHVNYKPQRGSRSTPASHSSQAHTPLPQNNKSSGQSWQNDLSQHDGDAIDEELALALRLSLEEEERRKQSESAGLGIEADAFPPLDSSGKGKGVARSF